MSSIQIPEPCHENWADFTPTQKGAFCGSCQIDVVDFSNKSSNQVKEILKANAGKHMCGRFRKSQLDELNNDFYAWENQTTRTFQSKFLYACLLVFGMSLFTSCNLSEQSFLNNFGNEQSTIDNTQLTIVKPAANDKDTLKTNKNNLRKGKIAYTPVEEQEEKVDTLILNPPDSLKKVEECFVKGDIANPYKEEMLGQIVTTIPDTLEEETLMGDTIIYNDRMVDGEIMWTEDFEEYIEDTTANSVVEDTTKIEVNEHIETNHIKGNAIYKPEEEEEVEEKDSTQTAGTENIGSIISVQNPNNFESMLFPNPTYTTSTVVINVNEAQQFQIYLYAINGKMVKDIYNGMLESGRQEFVVDLSAYQAGSYLIVINSEVQKESLRLEKLR